MMQQARQLAHSRKNVDELEDSLQNLFSPIRPNQEFVSHLYSRLSTPPSVVLEKPSRNGAFLVMVSGLFMGVILFWLLRRFR